MKVAGSASWRLSTDAAQLPHVALFVRDAVGLDVQAAADIPPRVAGEIPDLTSLISTKDRPVAGLLWVGWWRQILGSQLSAQRAPSGERRSWAQSRLRELLQISDPPGFSVLADRPELRSAVTGAFAAGCRWADADPAPQPQASFPWPLVREVAEEVAFDRDVPIEQLDGRIFLLRLAEDWWHSPEPAALACSVSMTDDPRKAHLILRKAFGC